MINNNEGGPKARPSHNRGRRFPIEVLTQIEITQLLDSFPDTLMGCRNRAICAVLLYSQARCTEMRNLRPVDVDLNEGTVTILRGKNGKRRVAALNRRAVPYIEQWLRVRPESTFLFSTRSGRRLDDAYVRRAVRRQARKAGIIKRVSPHICRHTGAYHLANAGVDLARSNFN